MTSQVTALALNDDDDDDDGSPHPFHHASHAPPKYLFPFPGTPVGCLNGGSPMASERGDPKDKGLAIDPQLLAHGRRSGMMTRSQSSAFPIPREEAQSKCRITREKKLVDPFHTFVHQLTILY